MSDTLSTPSSTPTSISKEGGPKPALSLTEKAIGQIKIFVEKMPDAKGKSFRVYVEGGGCSGFQYGFTFDEKKEDDLVIQFGDVEVLLDPQSQPMLLGSVVDYVEDLKGTGFSVQNPQSKGTCGCGVSFTV